MLTAASKFLNDSEGLEKFLRLIQGLFQAVAGSTTSVDAVSWEKAKNHLALARRYFRLFKWVDCWNIAQDAWEPAASTNNLAIKSQNKHFPMKDNLRMLFVTCKWSLLGMYFFLEMFTITNAMHLTSYQWAPWVQQEALKFWFYSICLSLLLEAYDMCSIILSSQPYRKTLSTTIHEPKEKVAESVAVSRPDRRPSIAPDKDDMPKSTQPRQANQTAAIIFENIFIDSCNLLIPGSAVGWIPVDPVTLGLTSSISSLLSCISIWQRVNRNGK